MQQASAIRDALKSLFSEPRLPDNPYFYLANVLNAYVDQSLLWKESDSGVMATYDDEGGVEVVYQATKLSRLTNTTNCWGLPHVLRLVSRKGMCLPDACLSACWPTQPRGPRVWACTRMC